MKYENTRIRCVECGHVAGRLYHTKVYEKDKFACSNKRRCRLYNKVVDMEGNIYEKRKGVYVISGHV